MDRRILIYGLCGWLLLSAGSVSFARADFPFFNFKRFFKPRQTSRTDQSRSQAREFSENERSTQQQYEGASSQAQTGSGAQTPEWQLPVQGNTNRRIVRRPSTAADAADTNQHRMNQTTVSSNSTGAAAGDFKGDYSQPARQQAEPEIPQPASAAPSANAQHPQYPQTAEALTESQPQAPPHVQWQTDLQAAHKLAAETGKPIMLVFGAEWCHYCKELEKNTLSHPEMAEYVNANFVPVHLDMGNPQDKEVAKILDVKPIPCTVILSPNAERVAGKILGYYEPPQYFKSLERARFDATKVRQTQFSRTAGQE